MRDSAATGSHLAGRNDGTVTGDENQVRNGIVAGGVPNGDQPSKSPEELAADAIMVEARSIITESQNYWQSAYANEWADSIAHFQNRHATGSKYHQAGYKFRSRNFRPKTRSTVRKLEAACATAFFGTNDPLSITAQNEADEKQVASAAIYQDVLRYRMKERMPWFQTVIGAFQDTQVMKACFSHNYWALEKDENGEVTRDELVVDLIPPENLRFHADADWRDPINTSPYIVHVMPYTVDEVMKRMEQGHWRQAPISTVMAARKQEEHTEHARDKDKAQSSQTQPINDYQTVWVCRIITKKRGIDYVYETLGEIHLLSEPKRLDTLTPGGMRNYSMGWSNLEAHRPMPAAPVELYKDIQSLTNDIMNLRIDNVRLATSGRFLARRGSNIDTKAFAQSIPGAVVMTEDPKSDIEHLTSPDTTRTAFQEQDYINADFDDIAGNFSSASVNTNRRMGETAAGMELMTNDSNQMTEYQIMIFAKTWMLDTIGQCLKLCQAYETDTVLFTMMANKNKELLLQHGVDSVTDELLEQELVAQVSVGNDATNPMRKVEMIKIGAMTQAEFGVPVNGEEVAKDVWGALGRDDGERFIQEPDPNAGPSPEQQAMEMEMQKMQAELQTKQQEMQVKTMQAEISLQKEQMGLQREQIQSKDIAVQAEQRQRDAEVKIQEIQQRTEIERLKVEHDREKLAMEREKFEEEIAAKIGIASMDNQTKRDIAAIGAMENDAARDERIFLKQEEMKMQVQEKDKDRTEQSRQADEGRAEQAREFDDKLKSEEKKAEQQAQQPTAETEKS